MKTKLLTSAWLWALAALLLPRVALPQTTLPALPAVTNLAGSNLFFLELGGTTNQSRRLPFSNLLMNAWRSVSNAGTITLHTNGSSLIISNTVASSWLGTNITEGQVVMGGPGNSATSTNLLPLSVGSWVQPTSLFPWTQLTHVDGANTAVLLAETQTSSNHFYLPNTSGRFIMGDRGGSNVLNLGPVYLGTAFTNRLELRINGINAEIIHTNAPIVVQTPNLTIHSLHGNNPVTNDWISSSGNRASWIYDNGSVTLSALGRFSVLDQTSFKTIFHVETQAGTEMVNASNITVIGGITLGGSTRTTWPTGSDNTNLLQGTNIMLTTNGANVTINVSNPLVNVVFTGPVDVSSGFITNTVGGLDIQASNKFLNIGTTAGTNWLNGLLVLSNAAAGTARIDLGTTNLLITTPSIVQFNLNSNFVVKASNSILFANFTEGVNGRTWQMRNEGGQMWWKPITLDNSWGFENFSAGKTFFFNVSSNMLIAPVVSLMIPGIIGGTNLSASSASGFPTNLWLGHTNYFTENRGKFQRDSNMVMNVVYTNGGQRLRIHASINHAGNDRADLFSGPATNNMSTNMTTASPAGVASIQSMTASLNPGEVYYLTNSSGSPTNHTLWRVYE